MEIVAHEDLRYIYLSCIKSMESDERPVQYGRFNRAGAGSVTGHLTWPVFLLQCWNLWFEGGGIKVYTVLFRKEMRIYINDYKNTSLRLLKPVLKGG